MEGAIKQLINQRKQLLEVVAIKQEEIRKLTETIQHLASMEPTVQIPEDIKEANEPKKVTYTKEANEPKETDIIKEANKPKKIINSPAQNELDTINKKAQISNKDKWTVILDGPMAGVYKDWNIAAPYTKGRTYSSYNTKEEAESAFKAKYKTVLEKEQKPITKPKLTINVPKIQMIKTKAQIEESISVNESTYNTHWKILMNYSDDDRKIGYYPVNKGGPKAVATEVASPTEVYQLFQEGLLAMVYTSSMAIFRHFPVKFREAVDTYVKSKGHGREIFIRVHSTTPFFAEGELIVKPKSLCHIGISNGSYPPIELAGTFAVKETYKEESFYAVFAETRKIKVDAKKKINYASPNTVIFSNFDKKLTPEAMMVVANFELDFYNLGGSFQKISDKDKKGICNFIKVFEDHKCESCYQEKDDGIIEDITEAEYQKGTTPTSSDM